MKTYQLTKNDIDSARLLVMSDGQAKIQHPLDNIAPAPFASGELAAKQRGVALVVLETLNTQQTVNFGLVVVSRIEAYMEQGQVTDPTGSRHIDEFLASNTFKERFWQDGEVITEEEVKATFHFPDAQYDNPKSDVN